MKVAALAILLWSCLAMGATAGNIPNGMPTKLGIGLFEDTGKTGMKSSGVPYQLRYRYLTYGWANTWGYGPRDGSFAGTFFRDCSNQGFIPAISYYEIYDIPPDATGQLEKMQNPTAMAEYFNDFKLLMLQAKAFAKRVKSFRVCM